MVISGRTCIACMHLHLVEDDRQPVPLGDSKWFPGSGSVAGQRDGKGWEDRKGWEEGTGREDRKGWEGCWAACSAALGVPVTTA